MTTCTLKFPKESHQQFIVCKNLFWPAILGLDYSHNYLMGIDWFSSNQLHLHQGLKSIVTSDPAPFLLHVNQISTLPLPHICVQMVSQGTILPRMIALIPTTFNGIPKPNCHYNEYFDNIHFSILCIFGDKLQNYTFFGILGTKRHECIQLWCHNCHYDLIKFLMTSLPV